MTNKAKHQPLGMIDACSGANRSCTTKWQAPTGHHSSSIVSTDGKHRINDCTHYRATTSYDLFSVSNARTVWGWRVTNQNNSYSLTWHPTDGRIPYTYEYPDVPLYGELLKRFSGTTGAPQLLNFFAELASLKATVQSALGIVKSLGQSGMSYIRALRPSDYASGYLGYSFGLAPVLDDVTTSLKKVRNIGDNLQRILDEAGTPVKQTWTRKGEGSFTLPKSGSYSMAEVRGKYKWKTQRFIVASYTVPNRRLVENQARFFASSLGLDNLVSATWEGVPFSFVVDWLVPIGRALDSIEPDLFAVNNLRVIEHYVQAKITGTYESKCVSDSYFNPPQMVGKKFSEGDFSHFYRLNQLTVPFRVTPTVGPVKITQNRGVVGTALILQKGK
jgi:hypothetical protein